MIIPENKPKITRNIPDLKINSSFFFVFTYSWDNRYESITYINPT